jgi:hypothetical protein
MRCYIMRHGALQRTFLIWREQAELWVELYGSAPDASSFLLTELPAARFIASHCMACHGVAWHSIA